MKKVFLHIGTHKTGSTSIQRELYENRKNLQSKGFYYPQSCANEDGNHSPLAWAICRDERVNYNKVLEAFKDEVKACKDNETLVISGEEFEYLSGKEISELKQLLCTMEFETTIVCYFKPQAALIRSEYVEWIKQGLTSDNFSVFWRLHSRLDRYNYYKIWHQWCSHFGESNVRVRSYEDSLHLSNGVIDDFYEVIGLENHKPLLKIKSYNSSPSAEVISSWLLYLKQLEVTSGVDYSVANFMYMPHERGKRKNVYQVLSKIKALVDENVEGIKFCGYRNNEFYQCMAKYEDSNRELFTRLGRELWSTDVFSVSEANSVKISVSLLEKIYNLILKEC